MGKSCSTQALQFLTCTLHVSRIYFMLPYTCRRATYNSTAFRNTPMSRRIAQMAAQLSNTSSPSASPGYSLRDLPKTNVFTSSLPADSTVPKPSVSHKLPRDHEDLYPRMVKDALYTFVRPEHTQEPELLAVSPAAMKDLGIKEGEEKSNEFLQTLAGNTIVSLQEDGPDADIPDDAVYPWAQCYGGYQFGQWAGQLGDGRAISLFETEKKSQE